VTPNPTVEAIFLPLTERGEKVSLEIATRMLAQGPERQRLLNEYEEAIARLDVEFKPLRQELGEHEQIRGLLLGPWGHEKKLREGVTRRLIRDPVPGWGARAWLRIVTSHHTQHKGPDKKTSCWQGRIGSHGDSTEIKYGPPSEDREADLQKYAAMMDDELRKKGFILLEKEGDAEKFISLYLMCRGRDGEHDATP